MIHNERNKSRYFQRGLSAVWFVSGLKNHGSRGFLSYAMFINQPVLTLLPTRGGDRVPNMMMSDCSYCESGAMECEPNRMRTGFPGKRIWMR